MYCIGPRVPKKRTQHDWAQDVQTLQLRSEHYWRSETRRLGAHQFWLRTTCRMILWGLSFTNMPMRTKSATSNNHLTAFSRNLAARMIVPSGSHQQKSLTGSCDQCAMLPIQDVGLIPDSEQCSHRQTCSQKQAPHHGRDLEGALFTGFCYRRFEGSGCLLLQGNSRGISGDI